MFKIMSIFTYPFCQYLHTLCQYFNLVGGGDYFVYSFLVGELMIDGNLCPVAIGTFTVGCLTIDDFERRCRRMALAAGKWALVLSLNIAWPVGNGFGQGFVNNP